MNNRQYLVKSILDQSFLKRHTSFVSCSAIPQQHKANFAAMTQKSNLLQKLNQGTYSHTSLNQRPFLKLEDPTSPQKKQRKSTLQGPFKCYPSYVGADFMRMPLGQLGEQFNVLTRWMCPSHRHDTLWGRGEEEHHMVHPMP